jgi:hypothetical protein
MRFLIRSRAGFVLPTQLALRTSGHERVRLFASARAVDDLRGGFAARRYSPLALTPNAVSRAKCGDARAYV